MNPIERVVVPTRDGYDRWADVYDGDGNPLVLLEEPHVARLLGDVQGLSVLDVGCGTGRHAVRLAGQGARVTGVDFSAGMLSKARRKPGAEQVTFVEHNITEPLPFAAASFDRVLSCLVLDHVPDVGSFFAELRRVCRSSGVVVASVMHPAMELKGVQARFQDTQSGVEVRPAAASTEYSEREASRLALAAAHETVARGLVEWRQQAHGGTEPFFVQAPRVLLATVGLTAAPVTQ